LASPIELGGDVVTGASALAGLFLVYLGNVGVTFDGFSAEEKRSVRGRYQTRGWLAFVGIVLAIVAAALGLLGKWLGNEVIASDAIALLIIALAWGLGIAFMAARDIR
jgi:hypothetical protein